MLNPWYTTMMLAAESWHVMRLRAIKLSAGGQDSLDEAQLMVGEKIAAFWEAGMALLAGGNALGTIDRYREHVAANAARLEAA